MQWRPNQDLAKQVIWDLMCRKWQRTWLKGAAVVEVTWLCYRWDINPLFKGHEAQNWKDGKASYKTGSAVQQAQVNTISTSRKTKHAVKTYHSECDVGLHNILTCIYTDKYIYCLHKCFKTCIYGFKCKLNWMWFLVSMGLLTCSSCCCIYCSCLIQ